MKHVTFRLALVLIASCGGLTAVDDVGTDGSVVDASTDTSVVKDAASDVSADAHTDAIPDGSTDGGTLTILAPAENPPGPTDIAVDSTNVYWITGAGAVRKCAVAGCSGAPTTLADGLGPLVRHRDRFRERLLDRV